MLPLAVLEVNLLVPLWPLSIALVLVGILSQELFVSFLHAFLCADGSPELQDPSHNNFNHGVEFTLVR